MVSNINNKEINPMDYAKLDFKHYDVVLNDAVIGLFTENIMITKLILLRVYRKLGIKISIKELDFL